MYRTKFKLVQVLVASEKTATKNLQYSHGGCCCANQNGLSKGQAGMWFLRGDTRSLIILISFF